MTHDKGPVLRFAAPSYTPWYSLFLCCAAFSRARPGKRRWREGALPFQLTMPPRI